MTTHELKSWPEFFQPIWDGIKRFEIRRNDRGYHVGDNLLLREWNPDTKDYTGRTIRARVVYITDGGRLSMLYPGYVAMGIEPNAETRTP